MAPCEFHICLVNHPWSSSSPVPARCANCYFSKLPAGSAGLSPSLTEQPRARYLAMAFGVGKKMERLGIPGRQCSSGYMGGQIHEDGTHHILFSLWDYNASLHTAFGKAPLTTDNGKTGCSAFGGEGTGGHCGAPLAGDDFMWEVGTEYTFAVWMEEADAQFHGFSGVVWQAQVTNGQTGVVTNIGEIFVRDDYLGGSVSSQCDQMSPGAYSFQEYFFGGNYYSAATWRGPAYYTKSGEHRLIATDAAPCCGMEHDIWSPPGSAGGGIHGRNVSRNETNRICRPPDCGPSVLPLE
jgi:hypothetical protein